MTFRPLHDRVLVSRLESQEITKGGIIIPDTAKEKPTQGKVVAIGTGYHNTDGTIRPLAVQVGDIVMFKGWGADEVNIDGTDYIVMEEKNIIGVVGDSAAKKAA